MRLEDKIAVILILLLTKLFIAIIISLLFTMNNILSQLNILNYHHSYLVLVYFIIAIILFFYFYLKPVGLVENLNLKTEIKIPK